MDGPQKVTPKKDLYYLCVSHSRAKAEEGMAAVDTIIEKLFPDFTAHDVLADCGEPLMAHLAKTGEKHPCYLWVPAAGEEDSRDKYFYRYNPDFVYRSYKPVLELIWHYAAELQDIPGTEAADEAGRPLLIRNPITSPENLAVQLIRLERK